MTILNKPWPLLILLSLIWGSSFWLIKIGLVIASPLQLALLRVTIAAICLLPLVVYILHKHKISLNKRKLLWLSLVGLVGNIVPALLFSVAQTTIHSALAGLLNSLQPLFTILVGFTAFSHPLKSKQLQGVIVGLLGVALILFGNQSDIELSGHLTASGLVIIAALCYAVATNIIKHKCHGLSPIVIAGVSLNIYLIPMLLLFALTESPQSIIFKLFSYHGTAIVLLGSIGTAYALIFFNRLVLISSPVFASGVTYLIPVVATLWGVLDNEPINVSHIIGGMILLSGLKLTTLETTDKLG
ncbi:MAG: DMT family transporter [Kangiellaceae bacterium]|jgi:drug/metabolite transporter (DMT)-like permease|nr:DMT family transporter [Kangiellaceae bacterium]